MKKNVLYIIMPCYNKKCNCNCKCKKPVLVLLSNGAGAGTFEDFLAQLDSTTRNANAFSSITVTLDDLGSWVSPVKKRLICLQKKYGRKASLVSTLFNSDNELQLARVIEYVEKIFLTGSTDYALKQIIGELGLLLPIAESGEVRSNKYYEFNSEESVPCLEFDNLSTYNNSAFATKSRNNDTKYVGYGDNTIPTGTFATDINLPKIFEEKFNGKLILSDSAHFKAVSYANQNGYPVFVDLDESFGGGTIKIQSPNTEWTAKLDIGGFLGETTREKFLAYCAQSGVIEDRQPDGSYLLKANQAASSGVSYIWID